MPVVLLVLLDAAGVEEDEDEDELCVVELEVEVGLGVPVLFEPPVMANVGLELPESPITDEVTLRTGNAKNRTAIDDTHRQ